MIQMKTQIFSLQVNLPSGNERAGSLNLGILPTRTTIDGKLLLRPPICNHQRIISIAPDIGYDRTNTIRV